MFNNLSDRLSTTIRNLRGQGRLTEDNIKDTLREVRMALLEADVALPVVKEFTDRVRERATGQEVLIVQLSNARSSFNYLHHVTLAGRRWVCLRKSFQ